LYFVFRLIHLSQRAVAPRISVNISIVDVASSILINSAWRHPRRDLRTQTASIRHFGSSCVPANGFSGVAAPIERAIFNALAGHSPNPLWWGPLAPTEFLRIVSDLTTWALTHFEPVRAWSLAEDLSAAEEQEGYSLIGRRRRMSTADYPPRRSLRTLREITEPKIRGSALWVAHALMSASHVGASDRDANSSLQERKVSYLRRAAPAARAWLANQQRQWPADYRRRWWITAPSLDDSRYDSHPSVKH
jgi:hypothetical protein